MPTLAGLRDAPTSGEDATLGDRQGVGAHVLEKKKSESPPHTFQVSIGSALAPPRWHVHRHVG